MTDARDQVECTRLMEVALPIRELSAESAPHKSLRHGHVSTLQQRRRVQPIRRIILNPISKLTPEMLCRQAQFLVEESDWGH